MSERQVQQGSIESERYVAVERRALLEAQLKLIGAAIVSLLLLIFGFYVLLDSGSPAELQKFAAGWIGLVAGYWLE